MNGQLKNTTDKDTVTTTNRWLASVFFFFFFYRFDGALGVVAVGEESESESEPDK